MSAALGAIHFLGTLLVAGAVIGVGYLLFAATVIGRSRTVAPASGSRHTAVPKELYAVTILKPLHGAEAGLLDRLLSFCDQRYAGKIQIVFGCQSCLDPVILVARQAAALRPDCDIDVVIDERLFGANRKVSNLANCFRRAKHDLLVLADSDIAVDFGYVDRIVDTLSNAGVGAVTCLYLGEGVSRAARLSAVAIDAHFLPNVLVGMALGAATPCFGSTIALRRETLARIGGFAAFADTLADDYAIGAAVRKSGLAVAIPNFAVRHVCGEPTLAAFLTHQLRVARTLRSVVPRGYPISFVTNPLPLAIIAGPICGLDALWLVVLAIASRTLLAFVVERRFGGSRHAIWMLPICDVALFAIFVASFCGSKIEWRGYRFRSLADGSLVASDRSAA